MVLHDRQFDNKLRVFSLLLVSELSKTLARIQKNLNDCVPLVNRINMFLPENERLDYFSLNPNVTPRRVSVQRPRTNPMENHD